MSYLGEVAFNKIYIIESIHDGDYKSGLKLYEDINFLSFKFEKLEVEYQEVDSYKELELKLTCIKREAEKGTFPLIHFEAAHGSKDYFLLKNEEEVKWSKFLNLVIPINEIVKMKLLISIGACYGGYVIGGMNDLINEHAPCLAAIGSATSISGEDLRRQYTIFYSDLFEYGNLNVPLKRLKSEIKFEKNRIQFISAIDMYKRGLRAYLDYSVKNQSEIIEHRLYKIKRDPSSVLNIYRNKSDNEIRELLLINSNVGKYHRLENYTKKFFMCDLYPSNYLKFEVENIIEEMKQLNE